MTPRGPDDETLQVAIGVVLFCIGVAVAVLHRIFCGAGDLCQ